MPDDAPFQPPSWRYEPLSVTRARAASTLTRINDQVAPLVARGDTPSMLEAQRITDDALTDPAVQMRREAQWRSSVGTGALARLNNPSDGPQNGDPPPDGPIEPGNIDLTNRPRVKNADGSISTVRSISIEADGKTYLIPTVIGDRVVSNDEAIRHFQQTGEHLGAFGSEQAADAYAQRLHESQAASLPSGSGNILGGLADTWRSVVPQSVRDVLGGTLRSITSAESFGNFLDQALHNSPTANLEDIAPGTWGTQTGEAIGGLPAGGALRTAFDVGLAPVSVITAGTGGLGAAALGDTFAERLAAQVGGAVAGKYGSEAASAGAEKLGAPEWGQELASVAGGLAGGAAGIGLAKGGIAALRGLNAVGDEAALSQAANAGELGRGVREDAAFPRQPIRGGADDLDAIKPIMAKLEAGAALTPEEEAQARAFVAKVGVADPNAPLPEPGAAALPPQGGPQVLTFDEFSAQNGVPSTPPNYSDMSRATAKVSGAAARAGARRVDQAMSEWADARATMQQQYDDLVARGSVRPPSTVEALQKTAEGNDAAAEAARRTLERRASRIAEQTPEIGTQGRTIGARSEVAAALPDAAKPALSAGDGSTARGAPGLAPALDRTNKLRAARGLPPLDALPAGRTGVPVAHDAVEVPGDALTQLQAKIKAEGLTPENKAAFNELAGQVFKNAEPPPPLFPEPDMPAVLPRPDGTFREPTPPGTGTRIGEAIIAKAEQAQGDLSRDTLPPIGGEPPVPPAPPSEPTGEYGDLPNRGRQLSMEGTPPPVEERGSLWQNFKDLLSGPRSWMSQGDFSGAARQGGMVAPSHPRAWAQSLVDQFQSYRSPEAAQAVLDRIDAHPLRSYLDRMGIDLTSPNGPVAQQEEAFLHGNSLVARLIQRTPLLERSERAYTVGMDSLRSGMAFDILNNRFTPEQLRGLSDDQLQNLGKFVNAITGRGTLPAALEPHAQTLNALFFAPRNFIGKVQANLAVLSRDPNVRAEAAKSLAAFYGTGIAILGAAHLAGLNVGYNPTSSDFGKITLPGGTRVDIWGGNQQMFRMIANLVTGQTTSPRTGQSYDQDRLTTVTRFLRSKLAPLPSTAVNVATGSDSGGENLRYDPGSVAAQTLRLVTPLFLQDLYDATQGAGPAEGVLAGALSGVGIGAQAYQKGPADDAAQAAYGKPYASLTSVEKADLQQANPGLGAKILQEQAQSSGPSGQAATIRQQTQGQQAASDQQLLDGRISKQDWLKQRSDRLTLQRGQLMQVYGNNPITVEEAAGDPVKAYLKAIQDSTDPSTGAVDPIALEQARVALGPTVNAQVDHALGTNGTPLEQAYRQAAAQYYGTPKYAGFTAEQGSLIDRAKSLVDGMAQAIPGTDRALARQRALRTLMAGPLADLDPRVLAGLRASLAGTLPVTTQRKALERANPLVGFFFAPQQTPQAQAAVRGAAIPNLPPAPQLVAAR